MTDDAQHGPQRARRLRPDLIIFGLKNRGLRADPMIETLRGYTELRSTPILILAAEATESVHAEMLRGRVQDYVTKPFHAAEISVRVRNLLAARRQEAELRMLSRRLISAQENERKRIARELHDDFSQRLAALCMEVSLIEERSPASADEARKRIRTVREGLGRVARDINLLSRRVHSSVLQSVGLEAAIRSECADFAEREGISVEFVAETVPESLSEEISLCIYRVAQESLRNITKHAHARSAWVTLIGHEEGISLSVKDSGIGFDPEECAYGLGLISIRERVRSLSGTLSIRSAPGRGTELTLTVPDEEVADE